ncbi:hypothetical protein [Rhodoplanes sp. SY1]|uniref:hypothetical protein n=1 Tax=Rhodoplanes sp. SY1 TaxID=3166646 RepID=UPI0038B5891A
MRDDDASPPSKHPKLWKELRDYSILAAYLYVWFTALLFYKSAILQADGIDFVPWTFAAIKALVVAKFMLLGRVLRIGDGRGHQPLIVPTLIRTFGFLVVVGVLTVVEEAVVGLIHGRSLWSSIAEIGGGTLNQAVATTLLMFLTFVPYFAFRALTDVVGEGTLVQLYFAPRHRA